MKNETKMKKSIKLVSTALAAGGLAIGLSAHATTSESSFGFEELPSGYMIAGGHKEGKCGEGKCGEGKCGEGMKERPCKDEDMEGKDDHHSQDHDHDHGGESKKMESKSY